MFTNDYQAPTRSNRFMGQRQDNKREESYDRRSKRKPIAPVAKSYTKDSIVSMFLALEKELGEGNVIVAGRSAEVMRGFFKTTHNVQFISLVLLEKSLKWLKNNAVDMHWNGKPLLVASFTPLGTVYQSVGLSENAYLRALKSPKFGSIPYLDFKANLEFWDTFGFKHQETEDHFTMVSRFMDEFDATEDDLNLLVAMKTFVELPADKRTEEAKASILSKIHSQPKASSWLAAFEAELA